MECPYCTSLDGKVIDSRLTKDRISIRRRRECLACSKRFTTYESTESQFLPVLMNRKSGYGSKRSSLKALLAFVSDTLKDLSEEVKALAVKVAKPERDQAAKAFKQKAAGKTAYKKKSSLKHPAGRKTGVLTGKETVLKIIGRSRKGVDVAALKAETGFGDKKIRNIIQRANKEGKIKRVARGVYIKAR